jgi:fatty-acid desaturase
MARAPIILGETWRNNHHAFPTSARHGLGGHQPDPSAWLISALERCRLAWKAVRSSRPCLKIVVSPVRFRPSPLR